MKDNKSSFMILISARIKDKPSKQTSFTKHSGYNARKVNCSCVYKNRCISVCLVSEKDKSNFLIILIIHIIVSFDQNISFIFYVNDGSHVRLRHPSCVYITAQR